jgi:hypothetical protein
MKAAATAVATTTALSKTDAGCHAKESRHT